MGQYYLCYVKHNEKIKIFDNKVDGEWQGLKLMEHSWWINSMVANVVNDLFYNKGKVCWVGDYYDESDYAQVNCDKAKVKEIGEYVWLKTSKRCKCTKTKVRYLNGYLLVNHTKKQILVCDDYFENNKYLQKWNGEEWFECIHPLPLLTCSASHSGGSYYGSNREQCGIWFNDEIEVVLYQEIYNLVKQGYTTTMFFFKENN